MLLLLVALLCSLSGAGLAQGLFLTQILDLAALKPVLATSTCGGNETSCNSTCPYGSQLPNHVMLLNGATLDTGVVSDELLSRLHQLL